LEANIVHNPSYTWRSIWSSQNLIKLRFRWNIGVRSQINVWLVPWIRSLPALKPSTHIPRTMEALVVQDVLNPNFASWNSNFINSTFNYQDASDILAIPPRIISLVGSYVWKHAIDGSYTIESAYTHYMSLATIVDDDGSNGNWSDIWKHQIFPKARSFLWHVVHIFLPTNSRMVR